MGLPKADRHAVLGRWGFNCTCSLCTASKDAAKSQEMRRMRLMEVYQHLENLDGQSTLPADLPSGLYRFRISCCFDTTVLARD